VNINPLENDPEREARIRARAYHLWEEDGRPHGRDVEFWERARALVGMEESPAAGQLPNPTAPVPARATKRPAKAAAAKVEGASNQANLGETTGPLANQGERPQTPRPRARRKN
jgi:Protein of unknown function (DUF2934)